MLRLCAASISLVLARGAESSHCVRDESALVQRGTLLTLPSEAASHPHPAEKIAALQETVSTQVEHSVGNMMGARDFAGTASEPAAHHINEKTDLVNVKMKTMVNKFNRAIDDMKGGMHELARGMSMGMKEASERIATQLAQSVHEHVREEIERARAAEPASLLQKVAALQTKVMMSNANAEVEDVHDGTSKASQGSTDFTDKQVNKKTSFTNKKIQLIMSKFNRNIDDVKGGMHELAQGIAFGFKEASEKIAAQLAQSVHEHVRQEIELARAAESAS